MKVLLINNRHFHGGGADMVYFNTAALLAEAGNDVIFFSQQNNDNLPCEQSSFFAERGGAIAQLKHFFYNENAASQLERLLEVEKPDIAHAHLFWGGISPSIFSVLKKHHVPLVHTAHDYRMVCPAYLLTDGKGKFCERCKGGKFYNCALHQCSKGNVVESLLMTLEMYYRNKKWHLAKMIDGIIFVSNFSKQKHLSIDRRLADAKTLVLYNCPGENVNDSLDLKLDTFNSYYLFYGRLSEEKGVPTLIKAFENYPMLKLKIVGTGPVEEEQKKYCTDRRLNNIEFLGYKSGKELFDLVARAKYVCVPSECYENNPMTIVEAYSLSTPVIGAAIGGISEIVEDGKTGFSFKSGDVGELVTAIGKASSLNRHDYQQQKTKAYHFAQKNFSREKHREKLMKFYQECIGNISLSNEIKG